VIGPNGAGKTTFFNLITGMLPLTKGRVTLDGQDLAGIDPSKRVGLGMARTFQITEIFPDLTVRENIRIPVEIQAGLRMSPRMPKAMETPIRQRIEQLLEEGGLTKIAGRLAGELSHGDQRATEIMMSLALKPRLLLLDEPTAGMGDDETYAVARLIRRIHQEEKMTIVLIEHDMRVVFNLADRITVLAEGRPLAEGTPEEITQNATVQAAYLGGEA
ncbi:MAG: ATP-binding cassette domain-containing protein, partial [Paracoccaceae bacterium]|nr:ATP-binding cassette domain-containing protein [Paracoccaceae bacterium]